MCRKEQNMRCFYSFFNTTQRCYILQKHYNLSSTDCITFSRVVATFALHKPLQYYIFATVVLHVVQNVVHVALHCSVVGVLTLKSRFDVKNLNLKISSSMLWAIGNIMLRNWLSQIWNHQFEDIGKIKNKERNDFSLWRWGWIYQL
jgi:hypothetical protein